jgi:DNA topoisomerase III
MKTLILTEKPSVARDFSRALNVKGKRDGYLEDDRYIITWAVGHLVELFEPQDYHSGWSKWRLESLPIIPEPFQYKPLEKTRKQLAVIHALLKEKTYSRIVVATDAGREGEVIARTILLDADALENRRTERFWTSQALTPQVILDGMATLRPSSHYDRLWKAGQARQIADWLVGMNGSRAATIRLKDLFTVGRVQTAVLALLVDRRKERENFTPEPFWVLKACFGNGKGGWWGKWFKGDQLRLKDRKEGEEIVALVEGRSGRVLSVRKRKKRQPPPPLYSLTDLQKDANRRFGLSAAKTLAIAQDLYEKEKCLSYPRTDSKVLGSKNVDLARRLVDKLSKAYPEIFRGIQAGLLDSGNRRVFDDAKLTDHHALIPLAPIPPGAKEDQKRIYALVLNRFAGAFHPDFEYEETEIITEVEGHSFRTNGKRTLRAGWRALAGKEGEDKASSEHDAEGDLPPLAKGDPARVEKTDLSEKQTTPPAEYTDALLLGDMTNPARYVAEEELKRLFKGEVGLGTQATRAQIIETLLSRGYAERKKRLLVATDKGCRLIHTLRQFETAKKLASPEETARWEMALHRIAQGEDTEHQFLAGIKGFVEEIVREFKANPIHAPRKEPVTALGICPVCGGRVIEGKRGYGCANWRKELGGCRFVVWKKISGKEISLSTLAQLLEKGWTELLDGFSSESGDPFSARLALQRDASGGLEVGIRYSNPEP